MQAQMNLTNSIMKNEIVHVDYLSIEVLNQVLLDTYHLMIKTQIYHWNVKGQNFYSLHKLFEEQSNELFNSLDDIAEKIKMNGGEIKFSNHILLNNPILFDLLPAKSEDMIIDLRENTTTVMNYLLTAIEQLKITNDETTISLLTDRVKILEKNIWMLSSSI